MNSRENREFNYKNKKFYKSSNYSYQRNQGFYLGARCNIFNNTHNNLGTSTSCSKNVFHSRSTRYYQHSRRESFDKYKDYHWQQSRKVRREPSPLNGSEEYTLRKIQETSDMIKRKLMGSEHIPDDSNIKRVSEPISNRSTKVKMKLNRINKESSLLKRKLERKAALREKLRKSLSSQESSDATYNVKEIHDQIMNHISKLNYGRKQNIINADTTCYDDALQQMYKQKSLELSKALREMSHQEKPEASDVVNSIIPDFAIKFEELPVHVIRELSSTFESLEKSIGNDITSFNFLTYSCEDQDFPNTTAMPGSFPEYPPKDDTLQSGGHENLNYLQTSIDDKVLQLNSEDKDSLVIKQEDLNECSIKMESFDVMEFEDDTVTEDNTQQSLNQINLITQFSEVIEAPIQINPNIGQSCSDNELGTSPDLEKVETSETKAIIGTVRVSKSIFENTNGPNKDQYENSLNENQNYFNTNCSSDGLIPSFRVTTNFFNKLGSFSSDVHSATHDTAPVEESMDSSSTTYIGGKESSHQQINEKPLQRSNNSELTTQPKNNIPFGNESGSFSNVSKSCDIITSKTPQSERSSDKKSKRQQGQTLLKSGTNCQEQQLKQNNNLTISLKPASEKCFGFEDVNATCHIRNVSLSNTSHSKEYDVDKNNSFQTETDKYFSITIKRFEKPKDTVQSLKIMLEIDNEIEKLNKLRQSLLLNIIDQNSQGLKLDSPNSDTTKRKKKKSNAKAKKKKLNSQINQDRVTCNSSIHTQKQNTSQECNKERVQTEENRLKTQMEEKKHNFQQKKTCSEMNNQNLDDRNTIDLDVNDLPGVPLICKVLRHENCLIIGTDNGKILYFNLFSSKSPFTVGISKHPISCLEHAFVGEERFIFTGTSVESNLRVLRYRKNGNKKNIRLEDDIQTMQKEWSFCFIGGSRGFLTRYNYQKDKIEFEDRISEMALVDLKATKEGARKILVILFKDEFGNKDVHVRDAMSALHMRTIGQINTINSLLVKDASLFFSSNNEIVVYNYCDGQFITKFTTPSLGSITFLHKSGNLLLATTSDGFIYVYNFKNLNLLGYIPCGLISLLLVDNDKVIFGTLSRTLKSVTIPQHMLAIR